MEIPDLAFKIAQEAPKGKIGPKKVHKIISDENLSQLIKITGQNEILSTQYLYWPLSYRSELNTQEEIAGRTQRLISQFLTIQELFRQKSLVQARSVASYALGRHHINRLLEPQEFTKSPDLAFCAVDDYNDALDPNFLWPNNYSNYAEAGSLKKITSSINAKSNAINQPLSSMMIWGHADIYGFVLNRSANKYFPACKIPDFVSAVKYSLDPEAEIILAGCNLGRQGGFAEQLSFALPLATIVTTLHPGWPIIGTLGNKRHSIEFQEEQFRNSTVVFKNSKRTSVSHYEFVKF